jgi:hypothetical protein
MFFYTLVNHRLVLNAPPLANGNCKFRNAPEYLLSKGFEAKKITSIEEKLSIM